MLRIQCKCGKFLKVNETLAGKKIKCPGCSEVLLVKAAPDQSDSAEAVNEGVAAGPPAKKMAAAKQDTSSQASKKRKAQNDDEDERPRKKKKSKKEDNSRMLLYAGGGGALALVVIGVGAWLMLSGGDNPPSGSKSNSPTGAKSDTASIKLFLPRQEGDKREIKANAELKVDMTIESEGKLPPGMASGEHTTFAMAFQGEVQTIKVNEKGEETEVRITVGEFKVTDGQKKSSKAASLPKGTIVVGVANDSFFKWGWATTTGLKMPGLSDQFLPEMLFTSFSNESQAEADSLFGTDKQVKVGSTWPINGEALASNLDFSFSLLMGKFGDKKGTVEASGKGKVDAFSGDGGSGTVDLSFNIKASNKLEKGSMALQSDVTMRVPHDRSSGPLKRTERSKIDWNQEIPLPALDGQPAKAIKLKAAFLFKSTIDVKYLGNFPVEKIDLPTQQPVNVRLAGNPNVQWMEPQQAVNVSVNYSLVGSGKPKADAMYILYVKVADSTGIKKNYEVQALPGGGMAATGIFVNPTVPVSVPSANRPAFCDIVLVEKSNNNPQETEIARLDNVTIIGINAGPAPGPGLGRVAFELSKQKVEVLDTKKVRFTVDYKVTGTDPDPKKTYRLVVNLEGKTKLQAKPFEGKGNLLTGQDTLVKDGAFEVAVGTPFSMSLTEDDGTSSPGVAVSNVLKGTVESGKDSPLPLKIQIMAVANKISAGGGVGPVPGGKKGGGGFGKQPQQQIIQLTLQWNITSGEINKKANYAIVVDLKGGKGGPTGHQVVPPQGQVKGGQFQKSGGPITIPLQQFGGETSFDVYIVEQPPGQQTLPLPKVSNTVVGKIL